MAKLSHLDKTGAARMVDISAKQPSHRVARARVRVEVGAETVALIRDEKLPKGDVLAAARIAGIMAAKRTSDLIPLCHPLPISSVGVDFALLDDAVDITAEAVTDGKTGVEMEAMTAAAVAALTLYDMVKSLARGAHITNLRLIYKSGGKSGTYEQD